jgi:hypothetical protein
VLQRFAELRSPLAGLPVDLLDALDVALQELDLDATLAICEAQLTALA